MRTTSEFVNHVPHHRRPNPMDCFIVALGIDVRQHFVVLAVKVFRFEFGLLGMTPVADSSDPFPQI